VGQATAPAAEPEPEPAYKPDRAWDKLLLVVGAAVVVVALLVVPGILNRSGGNPVAAAAQATMDSSGVRMSFDMSVDGPFRMTMRGNGVLNGETKRAAIALDTEVTGAENRSFQLREILDEDSAYIRAPGADLGLGDRWFRCSAGGFDDFAGKDGFLGGVASASPKEWMGELEKFSDDFALVGNDSLGNHYAGTLDPQALIDGIREEHGDVQADWTERLNPTVRYDIWIDDQGLLRRMNMNATFGPVMTMTVAVDFSDYGIHPQIDLPPDSQVQDSSGISS
jgi:hypothetical protein